MNIAGLRRVKSGDLVLCSINDRTFLATAGRHEERDGEAGLVIDPLPGRGSKVSSRWVAQSDVVTHYAKRSS